MKIIVLHGDDERRLYERLQKFVETARKRSWEVEFIDETGQNLQEMLSGSSLFGAERFFVLRNISLFGKNDSEWLKKKYAELSGNLIIYHEGVLGAAFLKSLPKDLKIEEFKLPVLIWTFLDSMHTGGATISVRQFHKIIEREAPEFIFTLIARHFRDLYWAKVDPSSMLYQPWRISKLKSQASKFTIINLQLIISTLAQIDIDVKTGKADLVSALDLLMLKQLE